MKKILINSADNLVKNIILLVLLVFILLMSSTFLLAKDKSINMVFTTGRAVIVDGNENTARKRALDDALYLASLQGGAKVDGYSSIDSKTNLKENLVVRAASEIIDFKILEEKSDNTHFNVKIQAALLETGSNVSCNQRKIINLSYLKPHFIVSSKLPAWSNLLPMEISNQLYKNISELRDIKISNKSNFYINPNHVSKTSNELDYNAITENTLTIKHGEFSVIPTIKIVYGKARFHRFSREVMFSVSLDVFQGPNFKPLDSIKYNFSLNMGNETGYSHIDSFYRVTLDKIIDYLKMSLSRLHLRLMDQVKCSPLETEVLINNQELVARLGTNQGLYTGKIGIVSANNPDNSMNDWSVVSVISAQPDYSVLETLNPKTDKSLLKGKIIRFLE